MALSLLAAKTKVTVANSRALLYRCPVGKTATVWSGTITNVDEVLRKGYLISLEVQGTDSLYTYKGKDIIVPYGLSIGVPKIQLVAGESIFLTANEANVIHVDVAIAEKAVV